MAVFQHPVHIVRCTEPQSATSESLLARIGFATAERIVDLHLPIKQAANLFEQVDFRRTHLKLQKVNLVVTFNSSARCQAEMHAAEQIRRFCEQDVENGFRHCPCLFRFKKRFSCKFGWDGTDEPQLLV